MVNFTIVKNENPVFWIPHFHYRVGEGRVGFNPWLQNQDSACHATWQKKFFFSANLIHSFHRSEIWTYCVWVLCSNSHRDCQQAVSLSGAQSLSQAHSACWQSQVPCGCRTKVSLLTVGRDLLSAFRGQLCSLPHAPSIFKASNGDSYEKSM